MLKALVDVIHMSLPCAGHAPRESVRGIFRGQTHGVSSPPRNPVLESRMRELTLAELDQVCSVPAPPLYVAEFAPQPTPGERALAIMKSVC